MSLSAVADLLTCPNCHRPLSIMDRTVRCPTGHSFDLARQGYVNLLTGRQPANADSPEMITARDRFLGADHYRALADAIADRAAAAVDGLPAEQGRPRLAETGAGTGYYLATVLDRITDATGIATDISVPACRRAARAHARIGAVVADTWAGLPIADGHIDLLMVIFAPRNPPEFARLLAPGGRLIVVTPGPDHLRQLREPLGLLGIEADKQDRLQATMSAHLEPVQRDRLRYRLRLADDELIALVTMGPNAHHTDERIAERVRALQPPVEVDVDVWISEFAQR
ncbi:putative RNA methyltransferase [Microlunatus soli]|uniref:23S rRNA m(1)G-748 methyltransferase n=1 Tax=Microlunatus soli TaxID=630515 RepID=A0A1H1P3R0_9ACTN|nr:hypothetical protein [Microlunatus soli]SDS05249.1 23S rRNA m(1)G-748 methyltransferase [Microlunatus soli]